MLRITKNLPTTVLTRRQANEPYDHGRTQEVRNEKNSSKSGCSISVADTGLQRSRTVEVKLSLKGRQLGLHEESRHDIFDKLCLLMDDKASTMWLPRGDVFQSFFVHRIEKLVQLFWKRS